MHRYFKGEYAYERKESATEMIYASIYKQGFPDTEFGEKNRIHVILTDFDLEREYAIIPCNEE